MQVELRHLQVVLSVAEAGSISRAAIQLRIAQSGLTAQLQRIEQEFGGPLFARNPAGVELTELGEHVVCRSRELLGQFDDLLETSRLLTNTDQPASPVLVTGPLGPVVAMLACAVRESLPDREQVTSLERTFESLNEVLRSPEFDVGVVPELAELAVHLPAGLVTRPLVEESAFVGLSSSHPLADRAELRLAELAGQDWVMPEEKLSGLSPGLRLACEEAGFTPRCRHTGADLATALMLVRSGNAIGAFYPTGVHSPGMVLRPLVGNPLRRKLVLAWRSGSPVAEVIDHVHETVVKRYQTLVHGHPVYSQWQARQQAS
ncbi:LysR family transcriptional regulator [Kutzneria albida]|uniref:LysR family transcription regulator n=1 Tax=Kutzneria albida DSM 43870 TaxID=1449976 RepID=W5W4C5_9PSEU|nr:LysR family transcriptional regulator [Kutzneria albida]AHH95615.1 LysR family transcription regulator [Kutzneria albida DSM 43870]